MITSLYLEGFKSFGKPVTIDFREITLLYGENSSGKSSILQALQYAQEVFCKGNLDCLKTEIGGDFVDLRGFRNFVHRRNKSQAVKIGITVEIREESLEEFCVLDCSAARLFIRWALIYLPLHATVEKSLRKQIEEYPRETESEYLSLPTSRFQRKTIQLKVDVTIKLLNGNNQTPEATAIKVFIDGKPFIAVEQTEGKADFLDETVTPGILQCSIFYNHALIPDGFPDVETLESLFLHDLIHGDQGISNESFEPDERQTDTDPTDIRKPNVSGSDAGSLTSKDSRVMSALDRVFFDGEQTEVAGWRDRISGFAQGESIFWSTGYTGIDIKGTLAFLGNAPNSPLSDIVWEEPNPRNTPSQIDDEGKYYPGVFSRPLNIGDLRDLNFASLYAGSLLIKSLSEISGHLSELRYIGPLRQHYAPPIQHRTKSDERSWADGLGAWDHLFRSPDLLPLVNKWLSDQSLFAFDCTVQTSANLQLQADEILQQIDDLSAETIKGILKDLDAGERVIIKSKDGYRLNSTDIGVGFSQILPIIVAARGPTPACVLLEQPELHIHVRLQGVLGDLLATGIESGTDSWKRRQFIVETHSEALLLRLMRRIRETSKEVVNNGPRLLCDHVAVFYIKKQEGNSIAKKIELDTYGNLTDYWPDDLFDISFKERFGE